MIRVGLRLGVGVEASAASMLHQRALARLALRGDEVCTELPRVVQIEMLRLGL